MLIPIELMHALMAQCPGEQHGAYPKGTRVMKIQGDPADANPLGTLGTVRGSICHPDTSEIGYMIDWESGVQGFIIAEKIEQIAGRA
jgi:hypothetical protein